MPANPGFPLEYVAGALSTSGFQNKSSKRKKGSFFLQGALFSGFLKKRVPEERKCPDGRIFSRDFQKGLSPKGAEAKTGRSNNILFSYMGVSLKHTPSAPKLKQAIRNS